MINLFRVHMAEDAPAKVEKVLRSGFIGQGPVVEEFEAKLAALVGTTNVLSVNSGTSALELALMCIGVGAEDEVISTPLTCSATNHAINNTGATIVWADVDVQTGLVSPESITQKITKRTKAVMTVDWGGQAVDFRLGLLRRELPIIVDSAHRAPTKDARYKSDGNVYIAYSFQAIKFLTTGDGGCLIVPEKQYSRAKLMRWFGLDRDSSTDFRCSQKIELPGKKYHLTDIAAAIGLANLEGLDDRVKRHQEIAQRYRKAGLKLANSPESHSWVAFLHVKDRPAFQQFMAQKNIATSLVHSRNDLHPVFYGARSDALSGIETFARTYCAIPCGWWLTDAEVEHIAQSVLGWEAQHGRPE
jgi:dTDP-4-amino-4,6-dideoxygalactose transaminase